VKYEPRSIRRVYKGAPAPSGSATTRDTVANSPFADPQPSTSKHSPSDDPTFIGKCIIGEASEEDDEVVAEFHSDGSSSSWGTSTDASDFCENKELVFEVDVKDTSRQVESHFSPPLYRIDPHHVGKKLGGQLETYDSDPEGKEEHDDQVGEPSSPRV
jgi:hypothetical protein